MATASTKKLTLNLSHIRNHEDLSKAIHDACTAQSLSELHLKTDQCVLLAKDHMCTSLQLLASSLASAQVLSVHGKKARPELSEEFAGLRDGFDHDDENFDQKSFNVVLKLMSACTSLQALQLRYCCMAHYLIKGSTAEQQLLKMTSLTSLDVTLTEASWGQLSDFWGVRFQRVLPGLPLLTRLNLSDSTIFCTDAAALGEAMKMHTTLVELDLSATGLCLEDPDCFIQGITRNASLHTLRLKLLHYLKPEGLLALVQALQTHPGLLHLELSHCQVKNSTADAIAKLVECNTQLQHFALNHCDARPGLYVKIGLALAKNTSLRLLNLRDNMLTLQGAMAVAQSLRGNTSLRTLLLHTDFPMHMHPAECVPPITASLRHLQLASCMGDDAATALADTMRSSTSACLQLLDVKTHTMTATGMTQLCDACATITSLMTLKVGLLSDAGSVHAVCKLLARNTPLQELHVMHQFGRAEDSQHPECYPALRLLATLQHNNTVLQSLRICDKKCETNVDVRVWEALAATLSRNASLNHICMGSTSCVPSQILRKVVDALRHQPRRYRLSLSSVRLWCADPRAEAAYRKDGRTGEEAEEMFLSSIHGLHRDKLAAFAMLTHQRLGEGSAWGSLSADCVRLVACMYFELPGDYLDHEPAGTYRAYEDVHRAMKCGSDPLP